VITGMRTARRPERASALRAFEQEGATDDGLTKGSGYTIFSYLIAGMLAYGRVYPCPRSPTLAHVGFAIAARF